MGFLDPSSSLAAKEQCGGRSGLSLRCSLSAFLWVESQVLPGKKRGFVGTRPVLSTFDLVLTKPVPCSQGFFLLWRRGWEPHPALTLVAANQVVTWGGGGAGRNSVNPGMLHVCSETNCWENPMTLKPSPSLLTRRKTEAKIKPHPETSLTAETKACQPGLLISRQLLPWSGWGGEVVISYNSACPSITKLGRSGSSCNSSSSTKKQKPPLLPWLV